MAARTYGRRRGKGRQDLPLGKVLWFEFVDYSYAWVRVSGRWLMHHGRGVESGKGFVAEWLYQQRGRRAKSFSHVGMIGLALVGGALAPVVASGYSSLFGEESEEWTWANTQTVVLAASTTDNVSWSESTKPRDRVLEYQVQDGDTLSDIAKKFDLESEGEGGVSGVDTLKWENDLSTESIKPGQTLKILPVPGVRHKVKKGETVYSIAKKYRAEPQAIVDFPFNTFANDETFALAIGQELIIPDGEIVVPSAPARSGSAVSSPNVVPGAGSGIFIWPAGGRITQRFAWYHKGVDIANSSAPNILAADSGTVVVAGWPDNSGYGNRVMIDHGNGYVTLYAHLSQIYVSVGEQVNRGEAVGRMGTTGRSTGVHLHFEIRSSGGNLNPLSFLSN